MWIFAEKSTKEWHKEQYATVENLSDYVDELPFWRCPYGNQASFRKFSSSLRERWLEGDQALETDMMK